MRVASWVFVLCTLLAAVGFFVPSLELRIGGMSINRKTSLSLYQVEARRDLVRQALAAYRGSRKAQLASRLVDKLDRKAHGKLHLDDLHDVTSTLDDVTDDDVRTAGIAIGVLIGVFCALSAAAAVLVFLEVVAGTYRRRRLIAAAVLSLLLAALGIAVCVGLREVAWEANDDLGASAFALRGGAYLIPIAAVAALAAGVAAVVLERRRPRA